MKTLRGLRFRSENLFIIVALCGTLAGCGGRSSASSPPPAGPVAVGISPSSVTVAQGGTQTFTASVSGTADTAVIWSVQEGAAGGTITGAGAYTAPNGSGTFHVVATSQADTSKSAVAIVTVSTVSLSLAPETDTLGPGGQRQFLASVTGAANPAVSWSVLEGAAGGTITSGGLYIAPAATGTYHVEAASVADASASAEAAVTVVASGFLSASTLRTPRGGHTATLLPNGKVLVAGGIDSATSFVETSGSPGESMPLCGHPVASAELYDPATATFSATGSMSAARAFHTATLLPSGKVLIAGGLTGCSGGPALASAELYDPATGSFSVTGSMANARAYHTATSLLNGQVLIVGGVDFTGLSPLGGLDVSALELYDPATGAFSDTPGTLPTSLHTATRLSDGKVLVAGGDSTATPTYTLDTVETLGSAALFDPGAMQLNATGSMQNARELHTAALLPDGRVLVAGGLEVCDDCLDSGPPLLVGELFDPATGSFTATGSMGAERIGHSATELPSGQVLLVGGDQFGTAELFDPATGSFTFTGSLSQERRGHTATLLNDGRVLVIGGFDASGQALASAEIYQ
jgi:Galactose oxidase, central domain